jgi:hypothetical protein
LTLSTQSCFGRLAFVWRFDLGSIPIRFKGWWQGVTDSFS